MNNVFNGAVAVRTKRAQRALHRYTKTKKTADIIVKAAWNEFVANVKVPLIHRLIVRRSQGEYALWLYDRSWSKRVEWSARDGGDITFTKDEERIIYDVYGRDYGGTLWECFGLHNMTINAIDGGTEQIYCSPEQCRFINYWHKYE